MAIECDGATYHSAKSARDRDRLRGEVLIGLGWHLERIWSTDWFGDPARQIQRLREAVERRLDELCREDSFKMPEATTPALPEKEAESEPPLNYPDGGRERDLFG